MYRSSPPTDTDSCWISPDGKFFSVPIGNHSQFARYVIENEGIVMRNSHYTEKLEFFGWMHWSEGMIVNDKVPFTLSQIDTVYDWIEAMSSSTRLAMREASEFIRHDLSKILERLR